MDRLTKAQRSYNMSRIRSVNTKPELLLYKKLKATRLKFKKHYAIMGKPDVVFLKEKLAIFIDGEYWHGKRFNLWKDSLSEFWLTKIGNNIKRDKQITKSLRNEGWIVLRIWGRDLVKQPDKYLHKILKMVLSLQKKS